MTGACRGLLFHQEGYIEAGRTAIYYFLLFRKISLKNNNFINTYIFIEYNTEKCNKSLHREDKLQMIILEGQQLLTSQITTVLKPYIGEAHLLSSILMLTHLMELKEFSFE